MSSYELEVVEREKKAKSWDSFGTESAMPQKSRWVGGTSG